MQDDAEIGLAVVHLNRISDRLVCNDVFSMSLDLLQGGGCLRPFQDVYGTKLATARRAQGFLISRGMGHG